MKRMIISMAMVAGAFMSLLLLSFTMQQKAADDFLKLLGISKADANEKIGSSVLYGSLDGEGINVRNIVSGNRTAIAKDILLYTKQYLNSDPFRKEYSALRDKKKPQKPVLQTPEEMQRGIIENARKSIKDVEEKLKSSDEAMKAMYVKLLETLRKQLRQAEDPDNKSLAGYKKGYPGMVKDQDARYQLQVADWETKYPANHQLFVKQRLLQFMEETKDIDFNAELVERNGIRYFVRPDYEAKSARWKMAFRAGREVVAPARVFVQEWIRSIP